MNEALQASDDGMRTITDLIIKGWRKEYEKIFSHRTLIVYV